MNASFAHNKAQTQSCKSFEVVFDIVQLQFGWAFTPFPNRIEIWINQNTIEAVDFSGKLTLKIVKMGLPAKKDNNLEINASILITINMEEQLMVNVISIYENGSSTDFHIRRR